jgi:peptidyl-prolyl cis-trans isomerase C
MRKPGLVRFVPLALTCGLGFSVLTGCRSQPVPDAKNGPKAAVVASIGSATLTTEDLSARLARLPPFTRARYTTADKKREFLDEQVRFEVLAAEAFKRGYGNDPEVQQSLKQLVVSKLLEREFEQKWRPENVPDADVEDYYRRHPEEFGHKEQVRILEVVAIDQATADHVEQEARAGTHGDVRAFASLALKYSTDAASKANGGDLGFIARDTPALPQPVVDAAFALHDVGDVSDPVRLPSGFAILMLAERRPGFERTLAEAKHDIQQRLFKDVRDHALEAYVDGLVKAAHVETHPELLDAVTVSAPTRGGAPVPAPPTVQSTAAR